MKETNLFHNSHIIMTDQSMSKGECLKYLSKKAEELSIGNAAEDLFQGFLQREKEYTTGIGDGIAIPHTRCSAVKNAGILVLKHEKGIEWGAMDDAPVYVAIALLVPDTSEGALHMQLLSALSRKLVNREFKDNLLGAADSETIYQLISGAFDKKSN